MKHHMGHMVGGHKGGLRCKTMKHIGFGHLETMLFTIKTSKDVGFRGSWQY